ncbi:hypothetical protein GAO09_06425 [Rhizobiales bacterium RZME27]|jgi:hypothetical protein|uniref:Uncharacterized protein n=1 Tax=Endobacterium cereale TaxID=2663029 RepID=A0A6A8A3E7_9HYPH|nr:hypothetical protein [Endobacterium cereale]MEB2846260.1 hypothetical protein [Endobacterium cereale]MQY45695.1 hypothetical protein [Endobacterium cereale]
MKFVSSVSMAALAPKAPSGAEAITPLGSASAGDGVTVVHVALSSNDDPQLPRFPDQTPEDMATAQKKIIGNADLVAALNKRDINIDDVVALDHADDGGHIIYVR